MLTSSIPIESSFRAMLVDNLNAELVLGSVTNVKEAASWLGYTYLAVRMRQNPLAYGLTWDELAVRAGGGRKSRRRRWCCCGGWWCGGGGFGAGPEPRPPPPPPRCEEWARSG